MIIMITTSITMIMVVRVGTILAKLAVFLLTARPRARPGTPLLRRELRAAHFAPHLAATGG